MTVRRDRQSGVTWGLAGVLLIAVALRSIGLEWGLPSQTLFSFHPDEWMVALGAWRIHTSGDLHPGTFNYGSLPILLVAAGVEILEVESLLGVHRLARALTMLFGIGSVAAVYLLGRWQHDSRTGLVAAALLAVAPGHVLLSHWATVDVQATFFVILSLALAARSRLGNARRWILAAAACAGVATAVKVSAAPVCVAIIPAVWQAREVGDARRRFALLGLAAVCSVAAFFAAEPFALIDPAGFVRDLRFEFVDHASKGHDDVFTATGNGWLYHLTHNLPYLVGPPLLALSLAGLVVLFRHHARASASLLLFALVYFGVQGYAEVRFMRYLLPLVPVLAVAAAVLVCAPGRSASLRALRWASFAIAGLWAVGLSVWQDVAMAGTDPREEASARLYAMQTAETTLGILGDPWFFTPPITRFNGGIHTREAFATRVQSDADARAGRPAIVVLRNWHIPEAHAARPDFVVASEFEWREPRRLGHLEAARFWNELGASHPRVIRIPGRIPREHRWPFGWASAPHDWLYPFAEIEIHTRERTSTP